MSEQPQHLTDEQVRRLVVVIQALAVRANPWGIGIAKLIDGKPLAEQRQTIAGAYAQMYEAMISLNMAMDSTRTPAEIKASLAASAKGR